MRKRSWMMSVLTTLLLSATLTGCGGGGGGGGDSVSSEPAAINPPTAEQDTFTETPYRLELIDALGVESYAMAVNEAGMVLGNYKGADGVQSVFRWSAGVAESLVRGAQGTAMNDHGDVTGWLQTNAGSEAFIYTDRAYVFDLPPGASRAYALDNEGRVAGRLTAEKEQGFLDDDGVAEMLTPELDAYAIGMNDAGQVLLKELRSEGFHTLLLEPEGARTDLGTLGGANTQATDLNEAGQVVGWSQTPAGEYQAFVWQDGRLTSLAEPEWTYSSAVAVSESGDILIKASVGTEKFVYLLKNGELIDLELFGREYVEVTDMNSQGQIVGWTEDNGLFRAFLATPR